MKKILGALVVAVGASTLAWAIYGEGYDLGTYTVVEKMLEMDDDKFEEFINDVKKLRESHENE